MEEEEEVKEEEEVLFDKQYLRYEEEDWEEVDLDDEDDVGVERKTDLWLCFYS